MTEGIAEIYCSNHPNVPTNLRCNRCGKPICVRCAVSTPTGYRCKDCIRGQQKTFETALWYDYLSAGVLSFILSFIGSRLIPALGFFTIFLSPIAGVAIAEAVRFAVRRRRSKNLFLLTAALTALGALLPALIELIAALVFLSRTGMGGLFGLLWQAIYIFVVTSTVYYRLGGIRLR
jgi:hypothetical protein